MKTQRSSMKFLNKRSIPVVIFFLLGVLVSADLLAQTQFGPGAQVASYTDTRVRGYYFTAPTNFNICQLYVPNTMNNNLWHVEVVRFTNGAPPAWAATTNSFVSLFYADSISGTNPITCSIPVSSGGHHRYLRIAEWNR